jgi:hypothetical protein
MYERLGAFLIHSIADISKFQVCGESGRDESWWLRFWESSYETKGDQRDLRETSIDARKVCASFAQWTALF